MAYKHLISKNMIDNNLKRCIEKMLMTRKEILEWRRNKGIRVWRRALYVLYEEGPMPLYLLSEIIDADPAGTERQLKKMQINYWVTRKNHKWNITDTGIKKLENDQKYGSMPILKWGNNY